MIFTALRQTSSDSTPFCPRPSLSIFLEIVKALMSDKRRRMLDTGNDDGHFLPDNGHFFPDDGHFFVHVGQIFFHVGQ
jgi:hypothetical protein